jgi:hypothetical protein
MTDTKTLEKKRDELAAWLADNLDKCTWDQVKDEYNEICRILSDQECELSKTPTDRERASKELHINLNTFKS